jgi:gliding motility-associated-like protein
MNPILRYPGRFLALLLIPLFPVSVTNAQSVTAANEDFSSYSSANVITSRLLPLTPAGATKPLVFSFAGTPGVNTASGIMFLGDRPAGTTIFRASNKAVFFNYTTGGVIPGASSGTGTGDYRIHFSNSTDTSVKSGNFKINSMYLAIGAGTAATTITIQGFRAGKLQAQATISGLVSSSAFNINSGTDLTYNETAGTNTEGNLSITFGSNWAFLDGLRITMPKDIPLSLDDIVFDGGGPATVAPTTQASSAGFTPTGITSGISWTTGSGDYSAVFIAAASSGSPTITNTTDYTANTVFGSGTAAGAGWSCVYNGQGTSTNLTGLSAGTTYRVKIVSYNGNTGFGDYNTTEGSGGTSNIKNFTTIAVPAIQAADAAVANITGTTADLSWTAGNGNKRAVFINNTNTGTATPVFNTNYIASTSIGSGTQISTTGWYCVFNGTGSSVSVTGLTAGQTYRAMVTEYNDNGLGSAFNTFNTSTATNNPVNFTTDNVPAATSSAATSITSAGAILNGSINDMGDNTVTSFQYSTNSGLATPSTIAGSPLTVTAGAGLTTVTGALSGLNPSTTYYYRIRGVNAVGTTDGSILNFKTSPVVSSVTATNTNGSYKAGQLIVINIVFSSAVTVTGTPTLTLNSGGTASYASGSGSTTLVFNYTIGAGNTSADLDYASTSALALSGGTIKDANTNDALLTLPTVGGASSLGGQKNIVIDTQVPLLNTVTVASNNTNTTLAKVGDIVTLNFTSSETIVTPTVTIAGHTISATNTSGNDWKVDYTMVSGDATGAIGFGIPFSDMAGNSGTTTTATTNSSSVVFDKIAPLLTTVTIGSNNANAIFAKTGDIVTLNFTADETINTPTVTLAGHAVTAVNISGNNWKTDYTMVSGDANGTITFNISFADLAGNNGADIAATTNSSSVIFDKTIPSLSAVSIASNNGNTSLAKTGDIVTLSFTSNEPINIPLVSIAGHTVTATNTSGNNWVATYTMVAGDATGTISFNISFSDLAANAGTAVSVTTNSSSVVFDKTVPVLSSVSIASNHTNTAYAKTGHTITLSFTSSEAVFTPTVTIHSNNATVSNLGGNNWSATYTMASGDAAGTVSFNIAFADLSGNNGTAVTATTNSSSVIFDKTAPSLSSVSVASNNTNIALVKTGQTITLNFTANETITTPGVTIAGHSVTATNSSANNWVATYTMTGTDATGTVAFNITFSDLAGNIATSVTGTTNSSIVVYDKTNPSLPSVSIASNNTHTAYAKAGHVVAVSFTSDETIATPAATILGHAAVVTNTSGNNWTATYTIVGGDAAGIISFSILFNDLAGNAGTAVTATTNSSSVVFDKTTPSLTAVSIVSDNSSTVLAKTGNLITVIFTSDETITTPVVTIAGQAGTVTNVSGNNWSAAYAMAGSEPSGNIPFSISFNDLAGNAGTTVAATTNSSTVLFDKTLPLLPTVSIVSDNSNTALAKPGNTVTVNFTANETIATPVATIAGHTVTVTNVNSNNWSAVYTMTSGDASGNVSINISFTDLAGNAGTLITATTNSSSVLFDKDAPLLTTVSISSDNANTALAKTGNKVTLNFTAAETINTPVVSIAGHTVTATNTSGNNWLAVYTMVSGDASGNVSLDISFSDLAGNTGTGVTATTNNSSVVYDKTSPSLTTVSIVSNNTDSLFAKPGDIVTLNFVSAESIMVPSVSIAGNVVTVATTGSNNWIANYTMTNGDTEGTVPFTISCTDLAGNVSITVTTTTNNSSVLFDKTPPSVISIVRQLPLAAVVNATSVLYRVSFSEPMKGITPAAFVLTTSGATTGTIASVSATTGTAIDVTVNGISGNGTLRLDVKSAGTGITDAAGNAVTGGFNTGESYTINQSILSFPSGSAQALTLCVDNTVPVSLNNILRVAGGDNGQTLTWAITANPSHGTLNGFPATATITGTPTTPAGLNYLAANGYTGNDVFTIQVSDGVVTAIATVTVTVNALPIVTITAAQGIILCGTGASLFVTANGGTTYNWYNNGSLIPNASGSQLTVNTTGNYTAKAIDAAGCTGIEGNVIVVTQLQKPTVAFNYTSYCIAKPISFVDQSVTTNSGQISYVWSDGNNNSSTNTSPVFTFNQRASYNVKLKITPVSCPSLADSLTRIVSIDVPVAAIRMPTMNVAMNDHVPLQARTFGTTYQWQPSTGLSSVNSSNTTATISVEQQYTIAISVASGCTTVDTLLLKVFVANDLLVPNIFSPNNDGQNDKLFVNLVGIKSLQYFRVFNRNGKKIFETNNLAEGWDGKFNGVPQPVDTYIWTAMGTTKEGAPVYREGTITLVR